jgi:hypothetical protein
MNDYVCWKCDYTWNTEDEEETCPQCMSSNIGLLDGDDDDDLDEDIDPEYDQEVKEAFRTVPDDDDDLDEDPPKPSYDGDPDY